MQAGNQFGLAMLSMDMLKEVIFLFFQRIRSRARTSTSLMIPYEKISPQIQLEHVFFWRHHENLFPNVPILLLGKTHCLIIALFRCLVKEALFVKVKCSCERLLGFT